VIAPSETDDQATNRLPLLRAALLVVLVYMVLIGGTTGGEVIPTLRLANGLIGGALIAILILRSRSRSDTVDKAAMLAVILFTLAGVFSSFPRQSLDAVVAALGFAAAFFLGRRALESARARRQLIVVFVVLSAVLTMVAAGRWLVPILEWWAGTGWRVVPPLNFELAGAPWGHRHDLTLAIAMLYPAWWIGRPSLPRRVFAIGFGVLAMLIVLVDGSRTLWISLAVVTILIAAGPAVRLWRARRIHPGVLAVIALAVVTVGLVGGIWGAIFQRASSLASLEWRAAMWGPLTEDWITHPVAGNGPGSFPWVLQLTGYFDTNSWAPRHPDSVIVQMLVEGGLLGIAALAVLVAGVLPALVRGRSIAALWALGVFAVAGLGASSTDFAFVVAIAIAWAAYGTAPSHAPQAVMLPARVPVRAASFACLAIIGLAFGLASFGTSAYERARGAISDGDPGLAIAELDTAAALDPGLALYPRQRGAARYLNGDEEAVTDLELAVQLNPADDLAWRTLALAHFAEGDGAAGEAALARAVELQRSDPTNLLLTAALASDAGEATEASAVLAEVAQAWPATVFAEGWPVGDLVPTPDVVGAALERWDSAAPMPELPSDQGIWLSTLIGQSQRASAEASESPYGTALDEALAAAIRCEPTTPLLDSMGPAEQRNALYWWLRSRAADLEGGDPDAPARMALLMGRPALPRFAEETLNPLDENGRFSVDGWGYRRPAITWPDSGITLPSPRAGLLRWMFDPQEAVLTAGLGDALPRCTALSP